jgi:uncharacterized protein (TIGR03000 family)
MTRRIPNLVAAILAFGALALATDRAETQTQDAPQQTRGTFYAHSPGFLGMHTSSPYHTVDAAPNMNGYAPEHYANDASSALPTYLTSINYPTMYGSHGAWYAPGRFTYGAAPTPYSTAPNIYGEEYTRPTDLRTAIDPDTAQTPLVTRAEIDVYVPAKAELIFQGKAMPQRGVLRRFTSPPLNPGEDYIYDLTATWTQDGREVTKSHQVTVRAGSRVTVDFVSPDTGERRTLRTK